MHKMHDINAWNCMLSDHNYHKSTWDQGEFHLSSEFIPRISIPLMIKSLKRPEANPKKVV